MEERPGRAIDGSETTVVLAGAIEHANRAGLDVAVRHRAAMMLVDHLGVVLAGSRSPFVRRFRSSLLPRGAYHSEQRPLYLVLGDQAVPDPYASALLNGIAAHALEMDDGYTPGSVHPSAPVIPAAIAAVQVAGQRSLPRLLDAIALGTEVTCRLAEAIHPQSYQRGFHNTSIVGPIGAAVAASAVLDATADEVAHAIGLAASTSGGLFEFLSDGSDVKRIHPGLAARNGLMSSMLAASGITGPKTAIEGPRGFWNAFGPGASAPTRSERLHGIVAGFGSEWRILRTYFKPYAFCRAVHSSIDAALRIRGSDEHRAGEIESIEVRTYGKAAEYANTDIRTLLDAQMSLPFGFVTALVLGAAGLTEVEVAMSDPKVAALCRRFTVTEDDALNSQYPPLRPARATVRYADGTHAEAFVSQPLGEPGNELSEAAIVNKAISLSEGHLPADVLEATFGSILALSGRDAVDLLLALDGPAVRG